MQPTKVLEVPWQLQRFQNALARHRTADWTTAAKAVYRSTSMQPRPWYPQEDTKGLRVPTVPTATLSARRPATGIVSN